MLQYFPAMDWQILRFLFPQQINKIHYASPLPINEFHDIFSRMIEEFYDFLSLRPTGKFTIFFSTDWRILWYCLAIDWWNSWFFSSQPIDEFQDIFLWWIVKLRDFFPHNRLTNFIYFFSTTDRQNSWLFFLTTDRWISRFYPMTDRQILTTIFPLSNWGNSLFFILRPMDMFHNILPHDRKRKKFKRMCMPKRKVMTTGSCLLLNWCRFNTKQK